MIYLQLWAARQGLESRRPIKTNSTHTCKNIEIVYNKHDMRDLPQGLRYSEQLPEGVRRIDPRQWRHVKSRLEAVRTVFPGSAVVGGTALRIWCELRDRDIPEETSSPDIDILKPGTRYAQRKVGPQTRAVDVNPAAATERFEEPRFTRIDYEEGPLTIITPPHLMVSYAGLVIDHAARNLELVRFLNYYQVSTGVVTPAELEDYTNRVTSYHGVPIAELTHGAGTLVSTKV
jgi:hypothetical protein